MGGPDTKSIRIQFLTHVCRISESMGGRSICLWEGGLCLREGGQCVYGREDNVSRGGGWCVKGREDDVSRGGRTMCLGEGGQCV